MQSLSLKMRDDLKFLNMITKLFLDALGTGGNTLIRLGSELRWFRFAIFCLFVDEQTIAPSSNLWNQDELNVYIYNVLTI